MIITNLQGLKRYEALNGGFYKVANFIKSNPDAVFGKHDLGDDDYVNVVDVKPSGDGNLEIHQKYVDVFYFTKGDEIAFYGNAENFIDDYNAEKDVRHVSPNSIKRLEVKEGEIYIVFPDDAHRVIIDKPSNSAVKRYIFKIKVK